MAYGLMGNGGLPSDMVTSDVEGARRLKVASVSAFDDAASNGLAFGSSTIVTVPANSEISLKIVSSSLIAVRFTRAKDLLIEYHLGDVSGSLLYLSAFYTMNANISNDFHAVAEYREGSPTGNIVITDHDEIKETFYKNGLMSIGLKNETNQSITTSVSIGIESVSENAELGLLLPSTQLEANTEMSNYG